MKWAAPSIIEFARLAGVPHDLLPAFAACALAASGGFDHYDVRAGLPGAGRWQGLWAIDTDQYPQYGGLDLTDPHVAADVARHATATTGGLAWCPAYQSRQFLHHLAGCRAAMSRLPFTDTQHAPIASHVLDRTDLTPPAPQHRSV